MHGSILGHGWQPTAGEHRFMFWELAQAVSWLTFFATLAMAGRILTYRH